MLVLQGGGRFLGTSFKKTGGPLPVTNGVPALTNGRKQMGNWGEITLLMKVIYFTPFITGCWGPPWMFPKIVVPPNHPF